MADANANTPRVLNIADASAPQAIPKLSGDLRPLIPPLGLHNYWYPAISAARVGSKHPVQVKMLGQDLCLFRTEDGGIAAIWSSAMAVL